MLRSEEPELWWDVVHSDVPITTQWDDGTYEGSAPGRIASSSSSMPTMVFSMLGALDTQPGNRVLEIGTGNGWNTALLCHRLGDEQVFSVEIDPGFVTEAQERLRRAGYSPRIRTGDGTEGYPEQGVFDRVIATCSARYIPSQWIAQCRPNGVIVAPWGPVYGGEAVVRLTIDERGIGSGRFIRSSAFMSMRDQRKILPATNKYVDMADWPAFGRHSATAVSPDAVGDWIHMFAIGVQVPDLFCRVQQLGGRSYRLWLFDRGITTWATADYQEGKSSYGVVQQGPRSLWDELEVSWLWWEKQGRPGFERFGLTTRGGSKYTPNQQVWLDSPDSPVPVRAKNTNS
ncbi:methyltransferase domain-containing protein [Streptomyces sp. B-S-A8]|uniref:Protein-L-isoaspartate O-methyltransferase n=1 Tax=Streptomyces solicavernae TaxID=3043614 RepID=A0ABT6S053_9ACTN|nr:methyltransferase domain-containing protein [Streptomyces sp. B-S-A8]MDI3390076.1 methyltransferase domain-containing protein [Streptomyces sp. B-S-A8]